MTQKRPPRSQTRSDQRPGVLVGLPVDMIPVAMAVTMAAVVMVVVVVLTGTVMVIGLMMVLSWDSVQA